MQVDRIEELLGAEVAALHGGDAAADHQVADHVEQSGAVHQRGRRHVAGAGLGDPAAHGVEVLFGWHPLLVVRVEHAEQVGLAPHHTLGHAGRAAGVEQQQMVAAATPLGAHVVVGASRGGGFVRCRPVGARSGAVVDPQPRAHPGNLRANLLALFDERAVEHDRDDVGVVPQVHQLVGRVPVVGVDGGEADLERSEDRLEVLGCVVEVLGDLVLLARVRPEQRRGDAVGAAVELGPRGGAGALLLGERVGDLRCHRLPQVGEVPAGFARSRSRGCSRRSNLPQHCAPVSERRPQPGPPGSAPRGQFGQSSGGPGGDDRWRRQRGSARSSRPTSTRSTRSRRRRRTMPGSARPSSPR